MSNSSPCRIVVLISGNGSNLQAIIDACQSGQIAGQVVAVISNRAEAYGLKRAENAGIPAKVLKATTGQSKQDYDTALMQLIDESQPDLIVLAGFMRILSDEFVHHYTGKLINIHPSLLPKYKGLNTHQRVLEAGDDEHGATVHFVIPELDSGPIILQGKISVTENDTAEQLQQRIHEIEHQIYPQAVSWFAEGRLKLVNNQVLLDNQPC